ncbi:PqiC family protein [Uliginosibacterium sp. H1]|uniref:PqiC family protein n=1 Tax=Uliginosibacterium sp. H1 TaxID=3114757 RepID=UPI002E17BE27|nr:PqiC family protein [Uliginosibacterium sp. H1]
MSAPSRLPLLRAALPCALVLLLAACGTTPPARYYQLMPQSFAAPEQGFTPSIGVGPVQWPEYLERSQRVVRRSEVVLDVREDERWAEPLEASFNRVLRENLVRLTGNPQVIGFPWPLQERPARQVRMEVLRFDSDPAGTATLEARWQIVDAEGRPLLPQRRQSRIVEASQGLGGEAAVAAQTRAVAALSRELASALQGTR